MDGSLPKTILKRILLIARLNEEREALLKDNHELSLRNRKLTTENSILQLECAKYNKKEDLKIIIGSEGILQEGWIATDKEFLDLFDEDQWKLFFKPGSIVAILAEHVWEHLTESEGKIAARRCYKYLKRGGYIRLAVPDGFSNIPHYIDKVKPGGTGAGCNDHKVLYNYHIAKNIFEPIGFKIKLLEYFDEKGNFISRKWDPEKGIIRRSSCFDERNRNGVLTYTSLLFDAIKV